MGKNEAAKPGKGAGKNGDEDDALEERTAKEAPLSRTPTSKGVSNGSVVLRAEEEMCAWAFDILIAHLEGDQRRPPPPASIVRLKECGVSCPVFVTWMKRRKGAAGFSREDADLRGCIGSLNPIPIMEVGDYVITSALRDRRFKPISLREVPQLKCHVSLLHSYEQAAHALDWTVGLHGTTISFCDDRGAKYSATYLPEIAQEMQMTQREAIASLVKKAGYTGAVTDELLDRVSLTRYQSSQTRLAFDSYVAKYGRYNGASSQEEALDL
ncbi:Similar to uniprot/Q12012 Saccharomyces cerevisiae YOR289w, related [Neospora caninum Liverpool]|uniref:Similar to uniprot/Q12012 Saccharomyces cerevisiae YOR289w, related n=1 Tax=Neospora caninum (strain Liverpool) TaxID=572307 RepID=F0VDZ7_NEOCL|nr:Similar to uniprot/Q12012 Saccharomyces cerevisiae YOR289w, related [Neospora caninum Liverpool]CBZ51940.1 Similar to uniprot/Q12012 Saccharomyces cerevisiae YOR289w, related [Neospora caninum Liverpool]CEL65902.1 TPA: Similar to uniprot/Q12012 Saccharomyces cerevisiae YOR289w, related [Neospora caninum Liverpool]|eukprot:XP_003881973.1 Similar to uniprot/Q12012 Saccharomyces cerevisiae YOR289w, related [Neospora caninum Liverpool]